MALLQVFPTSPVLEVPPTTNETVDSLVTALLRSTRRLLSDKLPQIEWHEVLEIDFLRGRLNAVVEHIFAYHGEIFDIEKWHLAIEASLNYILQLEEDERPAFTDSHAFVDRFLEPVGVEVSFRSLDATDSDIAI